MDSIPALISTKALTSFRRRLLAWYSRTKRDLDWRRTRDPYRIWISEIMLQQTRVAAVIPYYQRFLKRFPSVAHLARARPDAVLRRWAGLGYYSRARNLHLAAKAMVAHHDGKFPRDHANALDLPGIGAYTAAAVLSIAYDVPLAVLDGNVARVVARLGAIRGDLRRPRTWRQLAETATTLLASSAPGDWNQAMMELGATVCTPRAPRCEICPVSHWCRARALGIADQLPDARTKPKPVRVTLAASVLLDPQGNTLVIKQPDEVGALFSRMWQFPAVRAGRNARTELASHLSATLGISETPMEELDDARHTVTFREIRLASFLIRVEKLPNIPGSRTMRLADLDRLPVSAATLKIAAAALRVL